MKVPDNQDTRETTGDSPNLPELYQILFEEAPAGMLFSDAAGCLIAVNAKLIELTGYAGDELTGMNIATLIIPEAGNREPIPMDNLVRDRITSQERRLLRKDGQQIAVACRMRMLPEGNILGIIEILEHNRVTETSEGIVHKPAEKEKTAESQARLIAILENTRDLVSMATPDGKLTYLNQAGRMMVGWDHDEPLDGKLIADLHPAWVMQKIEAEGLPTAIAAGSWEGETTIRHRDGREISVLQMILSHHSPHGELQYLSTIMHDITEQKRAADELCAKANQLEAFLENAPYAIQLFDPEGHSTYVNRAYYDIWQSPPPPHWSLFEDEQLAGAGLKPFLDRLRQGETVTMPELWFKPSRSVPNAPEIERCTSAVVFPLLDSTGQIQHYANIGQDITDRKRAEEARKESEETFAKAFKASPAPLVISEIDTGRFIDVNDAWIQMLGYTREEQIGRTSKDIGIWFFPEERDRLIENLRSQGFFKEEPIDFKAKNGKHIKAFWSAETISLGNHKVMLSMIYDETERRQAEEELRTSENLLSSIFRAAPTGIGVVSNRVLLAVNDRVCEMSGYDRDELIGKTARILYPSDADFEYVGTEKYRQIRERGTGTVETRWQCKDGRIIDVLMSSTPLSPRDLDAGVTFTVLDITDRRRAAEALKLNEARLESLLRISEHPADSIQELLDFSLNEAIVLTGSKIGYIYFYDDKKKEFTLNTWSQDVMRQCSVAEPQKQYHLAKTGIWGEAVRQKSPIMINNFNAPNLLKKGMPQGHAPLKNFLTIPVLNLGHVVAVVGVANKDTDYNDSDMRQLTLMMDAVWKIVQRKKTEEEKEVLQNQLLQAQKMESVGRLAGGVAHDFNNMLGVILSHAELGLIGISPTEPIYKRLKEIHLAAQRSADLTRQLLAFARKQTVAPKVLDLNDTVAGMLKMLHRLIGEDIDILWRPGAALWRVRFDPSQIDQLLANLCLNARDAIDGIGKLTIETRNTTFDEAYCTVHRGFFTGQYVMLAVSDDGRGMDKEILDHVFEPFFTTKDTGKGTGLGLATVYGIVSQNEGFINVYSEPSKGSTFKIYLPRFRGEPAEITADTPVAAPAGGGEMVLLVEDEGQILDVGQAMLEELGYTVITAGTPGEALRQLESHAGEIKLLITDVVMPEMNGRDLQKLIHEKAPGIKCLFISGYTANVIAHRGVLDEGVHFLQKPFSLRNLAVKVHEVLHQESPAQDS